tara:strand:- start:7 stop:480 length:474 start_codon:yes stop_codon:yes gene_type:complete
MGCGKSTIGKSLAKKNNKKFIDLDILIEKKIGKSINKIFNEDGEEYFRYLEKENLLDVCKLGNIVVATGGGTPCFFDNMNLMLKNGIVIYLKMKPKDLSRRLKENKKERPLLNKIKKQDLEKNIREILNQRRGVYEKANLILSDLNFEEKNLVELLR